MKILIAPDKFKGSLTAEEVCRAIERGLNQQDDTSYETILHPIADGGDGSLSVLENYIDFQTETVQTVDPLSRSIIAKYYTTSNAAFIEVASASGLVLLNENELNPLNTSSIGTGIMIKNAIEKGYKKIYLFLGGSATSDAGIGIAAALGFQFLNKDKSVLKPIGGNLNNIKHIVFDSAIDIENLEIILLCDVKNPLYGEDGAAFVYGTQKGATTRQLKYLDDGLRNFSQVVKESYGFEVKNILGGGAAGGIGAGLVALVGAKIKNGFKVISELTGIEQILKNVDVVISGEGKFDNQSLQGKVIDGMTKLCEKYEKPLILCVGKNDFVSNENLPSIIRQIISIEEQAKSLEDSMTNGADYLEKISSDIVFPN